MPNFLDNVLARFGYAKAPVPYEPPPAQLRAMADGYKWDVPDASLHERQARLYAALSWIRMAVDNTAQMGAAGVYSVARQVGEPGGADDEDLPNHPFEKLLRRPNPLQSRGEFLRDSLSWFKTTGNLYLYLNKLGGEDAPPDELWILPSTMINPVPDGSSYIAGYVFTPPGKPAIPIERWQIMHLKTWNPLNPFVGLSAVQTLALAAFGDIAQQKFNNEFFGKDGGRFPGVLGFKNMVAQSEWDEIIATRDREWGGTNRAALMLLRGVGDNLQYLPAAMSQKEMEFLESRAFTRAEIFGLLAPGLDSILAINATEANAIAGKATLIEFGVWPALEQLGQKFEAELLPLYEDNLTGAFDDMRQTNRILDLQEQQEFAKYHTVNEVRNEYYDEDPLYLDESQAAALEEDAAQNTENRDMALAQLNGKPPSKPAFGKADQPPSAPKGKLDPRGLMFVAQIGPATPLPGDPTKPPPAPPMPPVAPPPGNADSEPAKPSDGQVADEMAKWERWAVKRLGGGGREFEPRVLDVFRAGRIKTALKAALTEDAIHAVFASERATDPALAEAVAELRRWNDLAGTR